MDGRAPFFSVVVPCCNVGRYVDALVGSVRRQSCADWECLLSVEDSDDDTRARCEAAARADARFKVLFGPRSGSASVPRNRALAVARGRYVVWADGDDMLADGALARFAADARRADAPDVIACAAEAREEDAAGRVLSVARVSNFPASADGRTLTGAEAMCEIDRTATRYFPMPWLMAMRADFVRAHALTFIPHIHSEDAEWMPRVLYAARRLYVEGAVCYVYRHRPGSATTSPYSAFEMASYVRVYGALFHFHATHPFPPRVSRAWAGLLLSQFLGWMFFPRTVAALPARVWQRTFRELWRVCSRRDVLRLVRFAGLPKRLAAPLVLLCGLHPLLDAPAKAFFRFLYYPLVLRQVRKRERKERPPSGVPS